VIALGARTYEAKINFGDTEVVRDLYRSADVDADGDSTAVADEAG
jgi:hypothetical protein